MRIKSTLWLLFVLFVAISLRLTGIHWGLPNSEIPHQPFHPDESWAMSVLSQIKPEEGDYFPEEAYREGPVSAYIWVYSGIIARQFGIIDLLPHQIEKSDLVNFGRFALFARCISVLLDVSSVALVFLTLRNMTPALPAAVFGALALAVCPFEIIYSRYMRTHTMANFFACLVVLVSTQIYRKKTPWIPALLGVLVGVCTATRYPTIIIGVIPGLMFLFSSASDSRAEGLSIPSVLKRMVSDRRLWLFLLCVPLGFLICAPGFLIHFSEVSHHFRIQGKFANTTEFELMNLVNFSRLVPYVAETIPLGTYPALWFLFYTSVIFLLFRKGLYQFSLPILVMLFAYLYGMGKGYLLAGPPLIRAVILMFPGFALIFGLAIGESFRLLAEKKQYRTLIGLISVLILSGSAVYDVAYGKAMAKGDPRIQLYHYMKERLRPNGETVIGFYPDIWHYFLAFPTLIPLEQHHLRREVRDDLAQNPGNIDYVLVSAFDPVDSIKAEQQVDKLLSEGSFVLEKRFENPPTLFGINFWSDEYTHDLCYPFPRMVLLRRASLSEVR